MTSKNLDKKTNKLPGFRELTREPLELSEFFKKLRPEDVPPLLVYVPDLLKHTSWLVKTDTLEFIGDHKLTQFEKEVLHLLKSEKNRLTLKVALEIYVELTGEKAIPVLRKFTKHRYRIVKLTALLELYLLSKQDELLNDIAAIVLDRRCGVLERYAVCHFLILNCDIKCAEVKHLMWKILDTLNPSAGNVKQIKAFLCGKRKNLSNFIY